MGPIINGEETGRQESVGKGQGRYSISTLGRHWGAIDLWLGWSVAWPLRTAPLEREGKDGEEK